MPPGGLTPRRAGRLGDGWFWRLLRQFGQKGGAGNRETAPCGLCRGFASEPRPKMKKRQDPGRGWRNEIKIPRNLKNSNSTLKKVEIRFPKEKIPHAREAGGHLFTPQCATCSRKSRSICAKSWSALTATKRPCIIPKVFCAQVRPTTDRGSVQNFR